MRTTKAMQDKAYQKIQEAINQWSKEFGKNITFGYIGNLSADDKKDDRSWRIFLPWVKSAPLWAIIGDIKNMPGFVDTLDGIKEKVNAILNTKTFKIVIEHSNGKPGEIGEQEPVIILKEFKPWDKFSAREVAEDWVYNYTDKGAYTIEETDLII